MIIEKNNRLEFTLENVMSGEKIGGWGVSANYSDMKNAIDSVLGDAKTLNIRGVNIFGGEFNVCFSNNEDIPSLHDDEIGVEFYSGEEYLALVVVDVKTTFVLEKKTDDLVVLIEK